LFSCSSPQECGARTNRVSENISALLIKVPDISSDTTLEELHALFYSRENLTSVPVLDENEKSLGLIRRSHLLVTLSTKFGRALYGTKMV